MDPQSAIPIERSQLLDLAVEVWRLERWLAQSDKGRSVAPARYAVRRMTEFLRQHGFEAVDLTGQRYEPGLAIEVLGTVRDPTLAPDVVFINEMVAPLCLLHGKVVRHGQAVTRSAADIATPGDTA